MRGVARHLLLRAAFLYWGHRAGNEQKVFSSYLPTLQQVYDNQVARVHEMTVVIGPGFSGLEGISG